MKPAFFRHCTLALCLTGAGLVHGADDGHCPGYREGDRNVYWGDLHVHTAYSLDAFAFGTTANPGDAFAFARGESITLPDRETQLQLERPLDFAAVTDHAETFDVMYLCTDPETLDNPYCRELRQRSGTDSAGSRYVFVNYLLPLISGPKPSNSPLCEQDGVDCEAARIAQWQRAQNYANEANAPCQFTAFIGNEWSATPNNQHWHRNLIYRGKSVSREAIDYLNYPTPLKLWQALEDQCRPEDGCDVVAIPHNTNLSEGGGFDVESSGAEARQLRARYERLVELHQSKGESECLNENWDNADSDCGFEKVFAPPKGREQAATDPAYLAQIKRSYIRTILSRGLQAYITTGEDPLMLGFVGSTDTHVATPGATEEDNWKGDAWGAGDKFPERRFQRLDYNPGGLVGVWAEENTRDSLFRALKRRETYATSGTRIALRFFADEGSAEESSAGNTCNPDYDIDNATPMGGILNAPRKVAPRLSVLANMDEVPLSRIEIVKGTLKDGQVEQTVHTIKENPSGMPSACASWTDPDFDASRPSFWYARVREQPTPRWSKLLCESMSNCKDVPDADQMIQERAWSSPIWYLP